MKLPRTTRGTSAPPNISLTSASIRLTHVTTSAPTAQHLRPRRRQPPRNTTPGPQPLDHCDRLGSPFAFHTPRSRGGTPSTVTSITESLHHHPVAGGQGRTTTHCAYWLRSSRESEFDCRVNQLQSPRDLRVLIGQVQQLGDPLLLSRCHTILVEFLCRFIQGDFGARERLQSMDLQMLIQQADAFGFWTVAVLPGVHVQHGKPTKTISSLLTYIGMVDRYTTPPTQSLLQNYQ